MQRDLKIGMFLGLIFILISSFCLFFRSRPISQRSSAVSGEVRSNAKETGVKKAGTPQTNSGLSYNPSKIGLPSALRLRPEESEQIKENSQLSTINNQTKSPTFTTYQSRPALSGVKTQTIHIVSYGETLSAISAKYYGSANKWHKIFNANRSRIKDANKLKPGIKLIIPD
jgi:nucleoid-associated protein YgaU